MPAETAVDEELSGDPEGNADHVLDLLRRDTEVARDVGKAVGLEAVDEILDSRAALHDERLTERLAGGRR